MRHCKKLAISVIIMALIFSLFCPVSYAAVPQRFGAWIASALTALNIVTNSTLGPYFDFVDDYLYDPYRITDTSSPFEYIPYTYDDADEIMDRAVLYIDKDTVTIDGVTYSDIWLSTDASEKFRVNAFDLATAFDIASQSEGTFVSGAGHVANIPVFSINGYLQSQRYSVSSGTNWVGLYTLAAQDDGYDRYNIAMSGPTNANYSMLKDTEYFGVRGQQANSFKAGVYSGNYFYDKGGFINTSYVDLTPFDFDWVSGTIPADQPLTDEGIRIRVPTDDIQQWYQDYPDTGPNITINMGDPDLETKVDDLIDLIIPLIPYLDIDFVEYTNPEPQPQPEPIPEPEPYPDPDPEPGTVITDLDWTDLFETIKNIFNKIAEHVSISTAIKNLLDKIKWVLDDILDSIGDLVDNIVNGNTQWFQDIVDSIWQPFLPWFNIFKAGVGIWHYVVTWLQNISAPFGFFFNVLASAGSIYVSPIYAVAAAAVVIAVYRRFGR